MTSIKGDNNQVLTNNSHNMFLPGDTGEGQSLKINLSDISRRINDVNYRIDSVISVSENDFLKIGGSLQQYLGSTRDLSSLSSQAAEYISEDILKKGIKELTWLLKQFGESLTDSAKEIRNDREELLLILSKINQISNEFKGFGKIVKQLRMLGISTKIESSRLGSEDAGFFQLAEYVDKLSGFIGDKVQGITTKSDFLIKEINRTAEKLNNLEIEQKEQSNTILQKTSQSLVIFENKYIECSNKANSISESSNLVRQNINDIVMSIQFHDITRQQMEHAKEALTEVKDIDRKHLTGGTPDEMEEIGVVYDVCELQAYQLDYSANEFINAAKKIINNLNGVEDNVGAILSETCELLNEKDSRGGLSLLNVKDELTKVSNGIKNNFKITSELAISIKSVLGIIEDLANSVEEIEDIGSDIELISLNARIKAAHIGSDGASLGILSEEIQKLSISTKNQTESISLLLHATGETSKKLEENLDKGNDSGNSLEVTDNKIHGLMNSMMELEKKASGIIETLKEDINGLKGNINETIDGITIHSKVEHEIGGIVSELHQVTSYLKPFVDPEEKREKNIKKLAGKYTMNQERKIHQQFIEGKMSSSNKNHFEIQKDEDNLGDNVELF
ncbi:MAG: methyl-accepting chemotaxis protein [Bacteroidetes bacterium]|nr:methyl-accepting chemotaxis protein [Bacteroidota bacterium]